MKVWAPLQDGVHYHFTTKKEFEKGIADGKFLEYAYVHNNIYGTSLKAVEAVAAAGKCCVLDIDVQGARQVSQHWVCYFLHGCVSLNLAQACWSCSMPHGASSAARSPWSFG